MQRARPWTPPSPSASQRAQRIQTSPRTCRQKPRPRRRSPGRCLPGAGSPPQRDARSCPAPRHPLHSSYGAHSGHRHGAFRPQASRGRRAQRCKRRRTSRAQCHIRNQAGRRRPPVDWAAAGGDSSVSAAVAASAPAVACRRRAAATPRPVQPPSARPKGVGRVPTCCNRGWFDLGAAWFVLRRPRPRSIFAGSVSISTCARAPPCLPPPRPTLWRRCLPSWKVVTVQSSNHTGSAHAACAERRASHSAR